MTKLDSLIFDLDGTLWDSTPAAAVAWNQSVRASGLKWREFTADDIRGIAGLTHPQIMERLLPGITHDRYAFIAADVLKRECECIERGKPFLFPGVREGLEQLAKRYPLFLVSNCGVEYAKTFFKWSGLGGYFRDFETHGNTGRPKVENVRSVIVRNHLVSPAYVGDTDVDEGAALGNSIPFYWVSYGFGRPVRNPGRGYASFAELAHALI